MVLLFLHMCLKIQNNLCLLLFETFVVLLFSKDTITKSLNTKKNHNYLDEQFISLQPISEKLLYFFRAAFFPFKYIFLFSILLKIKLIGGYYPASWMADQGWNKTYLSFVSFGKQDRYNKTNFSKITLARKRLSSPVVDRPTPCSLYNCAHSTHYV